MYEHITFEDILQRMLDRVSNQMDKREGSIIYDALAPAAIELQLMYIEFDIILQETFGDSASREYLIRRAAERGIIPDPATYAVLKAEFAPSTLEIPIGQRFSSNELNYHVTKKLSDGVYQVECESIGVVGNKYFGELIPIDYVNGLISAALTELLIPGEDEEETESIRKRYFETFSTKAYGGNKKDYLDKTNSIAGVGATKVTPVWNGGGTVRLTILNSEYDKASNTLIQTVQQEIDPTQDGHGVGIAPIGHIVTVDTAIEKIISINTTITFEEGYSFDGQKQNILDAVEKYMKELRQVWASENNNVIRVSQIETRILNITGVLDITNTKINGSTGNLALEPLEIPVLGGITNG